MPSQSWNFLEHDMIILFTWRQYDAVGTSWSLRTDEFLCNDVLTHLNPSSMASRKSLPVTEGRYPLPCQGWRQGACGSSNGKWRDRRGRCWKQRQEYHFKKQKDLFLSMFSGSSPQASGAEFNRALLSGARGGGGVPGPVLWRLSAGTFPSPASVSLRTHPSAHLGSASAGCSCMCWQKKNLLTCRRLVIFRFCEKTLTNLFSQPVFAFSSSLLSPPLGWFGSLALPSLRLFRIRFANLGI